MYAQRRFSSSLLQPIFTVILILITLPTSYTNNSSTDQYESCSNRYNCGENIKGVGYPFWGEDRPRICGLEGFELRCQTNDHRTIYMGNQAFRVLSINESSLEMTMARDDLWNDICSQKLDNTTLNDTLFRYGLDVGTVKLYYNCPSDLNVASTSFWVKTTCKVNGVVTSNYLYTSDPLPGLEQCTSNVSVPVLKTGLQEMRNNKSLKLEDVLKQGFVVDYKIDETDCSACVRSGGLCWSGTNTTQSTCLCKDAANPSVCLTPNKGSGLNIGTKIGIGIGAAIIGIVCSIIYCFIRKSSSSTSGSCWSWRTLKDEKVEAFIKQYRSSLPIRYWYSDVKKMTNSFKDELGRGGFGGVYKGKLPGGRLVAVKLLNSAKGHGEDFINEVASIGRTSHVNIVTLLGFCYEGEKRALIYEYMPNGSLDKFIFHRETPVMTKERLGWEDLYKITLGIARGLEYLHRGCNTRILHLDIKPHNILLDKDFCPKISDFGLAKLHSGKDSIVSMKDARGTYGYIAPEMYNRKYGGVSHKSDVYSYGMMVLEIAGGRKNLDAEVVQSSEIYFPQWIYKRLELDEDLNLQGEMTTEENEIARKMLIVGSWCIQTNPLQRPSMNKVIEMFEGNKEALPIPPYPFFFSPPTSESNSLTQPILSSIRGSAPNSSTIL